MTVVPILSYVFTKAEFITCYNSCHSDGTIRFSFLKWSNSQAALTQEAWLVCPYNLFYFALICRVPRYPSLNETAQQSPHLKTMFHILTGPGGRALFLKSGFYHCI